MIYLSDRRLEELIEAHDLSGVRDYSPFAQNAQAVHAALIELRELRAEGPRRDRRRTITPSEESPESPP